MAGTCVLNAEGGYATARYNGLCRLYQEFVVPDSCAECQSFCSLLSSPLLILSLFFLFSKVRVKCYPHGYDSRQFFKASACR